MKVSNNENEPIIIVGGGLSGLVAAINLARINRRVQVYDNNNNDEEKYSIHTARFNIDKVCDYINIDIHDCFSKVEEETAYLYQKKYQIKSKALACERGNRKGSIDSFLRQLAIDSGVEFYNENYLIKSNNDSTQPVILATGLGSKSYEILGIENETIVGFEARMEFNDTVKLISFKDRFTNNDYAYMASKNNVIYTLLFSRKRLPDKALEQYQKKLLHKTGLRFTKWYPVRGMVPNVNNLFKQNYILSGTLSGLIDPFFLSGIIPALISGKIVASLFMDRDKAIREYLYFTRNFRIKQFLHSCISYRKFPNILKKYIIYLHTLIKDVGKP